MRNEYEARFCDIDPAEIRRRLAEAGALCTMPRTLMRRVIFDGDLLPDRAWLRVRDEGRRVTVTLKRVEGSMIDGVKEAELTVGDFDSAQQFFLALGLSAVRYQENYREEHVLDGVAYDLDTWPDLPTFLEVEAVDVAGVERGAALLGMDMTTASYGSVDEVYRARLGRDILGEDRLVFTASAAEGYPEAHSPPGQQAL